MNKKIVRICIILIIVISIFSFYLYFTSPIVLDDIISKESIEAIRIAVYFPNDLDENEYNQFFRIEDKKDIDEAINILDNYQYKKKFKFKNLIRIHPRSYPANSDPYVQMVIFYEDSHELAHQRIDINPDSSVDIANERRIMIEYRTSRNNEKIFGELSKWVKPICKEKLSDSN